MIERGERPRLALEAREPVVIPGEEIGQDLQRDVPPEPGVAGLVDLSHPAGAKRSDDLVRTEAAARGQRHAGG
jgi:hypothetical protein